MAQQMRSSSAEERAASRRKELAIIKASNEMLEQARQDYIRHVGEEIGDEERKVLDSIGNAMDENLQMARNYYGASKRDVDASEYHGPSQGEIRKYQYRLAKKKMTHEQMARKEIATVTAGPSKGKAASAERPRRRVRGLGYTDDPNAINRIWDDTKTYTEKDVIKAKRVERAIDEDDPITTEWNGQTASRRPDGLERKERRTRESRRRGVEVLEPNATATVVNGTASGVATATVGRVSVSVNR